MLASLAVLSLAALCGLPFLQIAPNRLVSGQPLYFFSLLQGVAWLPSRLLASLLVASVVAASVVCFLKQSRWWLTAALVLTALALPSLLWFAASQASAGLQGQTGLTNLSGLSRSSLGGGFWLAFVLLAFAVSSALQQLRTSALQSACAGAVLLICLAVLLASGACSDLSLVKEYANRADGFAQVIARHLQIVALAMAFTLAIGLPLAWAAHVRPAVGTAVFAVLNIVQTIPSIALFGLLMLPLALLAAAAPALGRAGISGVGLAPAVIALTLYALLPVVRSALTGLQQVSSSTASAALALGLTRLQVLWAIELPLALPIALGGVRTAAVATVGLAAVSALIGAGGLGSIVFEGLFANAQDLVLLGVLPIVALGVLTDLLFKALTAWARLKAQPQ